MSDDREAEIEGMLAQGGVPETGTPRPKVPVPGTHHSLTEDGLVRAARVGNDYFDEQVVGALAANCPLYRYQGEVGSIETTPREGTRFRRATKEHVRELVDQHVTLVKTGVVNDKKTGLRITETEVTTSADLAGLVLDRLRRDARIPEVRYILEYPAYAPGWAPIQAGFNPGGFFYAEPLELKGIGKFTGVGKQKLEPDQIRKHFDDLLADFPFATQTDKENFVALMLTFLVRPALDHNVPLFLVQASRERTGKSKLLTEVLGPTLFGQHLIASNLKANDEEAEKTITSVLVSGRSYLFYDNVEREIGGERLCSMLTSRMLADRILGTTNHTIMENNLICMATSNNASIAKDMAGRLVVVNLVPPCAEPERRTGFAHPDIFAYALERRRRTLLMLKGMIENWRNLGCPGHPTFAMGSFERWARDVGGVMHVNGFTKWMEGWALEPSTLDAQLADLMLSWWTRAQTTPSNQKSLRWTGSATTAEGKQILEVGKEADFLSDIHERIVPTVSKLVMLGKKLEKVFGRPVRVRPDLVLTVERTQRRPALYRLSKYEKDA